MASFTFSNSSWNYNISQLSRNMIYLLVNKDEKKILYEIIGKKSENTFFLTDKQTSWKNFCCAPPNFRKNVPSVTKLAAIVFKNCSPFRLRLFKVYNAHFNLIRKWKIEWYISISSEAMTMLRGHFKTIFIFKLSQISIGSVLSSLVDLKLTWQFEEIEGYFSDIKSFRLEESLM